MPMTEHGFMDPNNEDRADFAKVALDAYRDRVKGDFATAFRDLVCDLGHLWDASAEELGDEYCLWEDEVQFALRGYHEEKLEEED
jgi:hypothetical protein